MERFNYFVPGIYDQVDDARMWDYRAQGSCYHRGLGLSAGFNYYADVIGALTHETEHAAQIASDLRMARQAESAGGRQFSPMVAAGHSHGAKLLTLALQLFPGTMLDELHLIAGAMSADCNENGLNRAAINGQVGRVIVYKSARDEWVGKFPGYEGMGKVGPTNVCRALAAILCVVERDRKHGEWVGKNFEETMQLFVNGGRE